MYMSKRISIYILLLSCYILCYKYDPALCEEIAQNTKDTNIEPIDDRLWIDKHCVEVTTVLTIVCLGLGLINYSLGYYDGITDDFKELFRMFGFGSSNPSDETK